MIAALLLSGRAWAAQSDWVATLQPPDDGIAYKPAEPLVVSVPADLALPDLLRLALEVDAIDVTPLLAFENQAFVYAPPQPLAPGPHDIRILEAAPDGTTTPHGAWTIEVAPGGDQVAILPGSDVARPVETATRHLSFNASNTVELSQRLAEHNIVDAPDRLVTSGSGYFDGALSQGPWQVKGNGNYLANSVETRTPTGESVDLGEYGVEGRFDGETLFGRAAFGHHGLGVDNYILSPTQRRGASVTLGRSGGLVSATGFGFRPEPLVGAEDFTGLNDSHNRLLGATVTSHPIPSLGDDLAVSGTYYAGEGSDLGIGGVGDSVANEGDGWAFVADSYWFDRKLQVRGEFAQTEFDYGDVVLGDGEADGNAGSVLVAYSPIQGEEVAGDFMSLTLGARYERIETFFNSLANPNVAADRNTVLLYSDLVWGDVSIGLQGRHQTNNVDDLNGMPRDRLLGFDLAGAYYPTLESEEPGSLAWLGQPFVNFAFGISDNSREETPAGYAGTGTDNQTRTATLGIGSSYDSWSWSLSQTAARFVDDANTAADKDSHTTDVLASWIVNDRLQLDGGVQWNLLRDRDADTDIHSVNLNVGVGAEILPGELEARANYNLNLLAGDGDTPDKSILSGQVEWTVVQPQPNRIGLALALQGLWENNDGNADASLNGTSWQAFTLLRLIAPLSY